MNVESESKDPWTIWSKYLTNNSIDSPKPWFLNIDPTTDPRILIEDSKGETKNITFSTDTNNDLVIDIPAGTTINFNVFSVSKDHYKNNKGNIKTHQNELEDRTFMQTKSDWKNVEITGYVQFDQLGGKIDFIWSARGGLDNPENICESTSYRSRISSADPTMDFMQGAIFEKNQIYEKTTKKSKKGFTFNPGWIGIKFIIHNINDEKNVKLQLYIDKSINEKKKVGTTEEEWELINDETDSGNWGNEGGQCHGKEDQIITWGGPVAGFKISNDSNFARPIKFKYASVKEIIL